MQSWRRLLLLDSIWRCVAALSVVAVTIVIDLGCSMTKRCSSFAARNLWCCVYQTPTSVVRRSMCLGELLLVPLLLPLFQLAVSRPRCSECSWPVEIEKGSHQPCKEVHSHGAVASVLIGQYFVAPGTASPSDRTPCRGLLAPPLWRVLAIGVCCSYCHTQQVPCTIFDRFYRISCSACVVIIRRPASLAFMTRGRSSGPVRLDKSTKIACPRDVSQFHHSATILHDALWACVLTDRSMIHSGPVCTSIHAHDIVVPYYRPKPLVVACSKLSDRRE